jgi:hypothetical protein
VGFLFNFKQDAKI